MARRRDGGRERGPPARARRWRMAKAVGSNRGLSRRALLRVGAFGAAATALGPAARRAAAVAATDYVPRPNATAYVLRVAATAQNPDATTAVSAITADGTIPGPLIRARQ